MSASYDERPRYKPAQPTPEQQRVIRDMLSRLSGAQDEPGADASEPPPPDDPA